MFRPFYWAILRLYLTGVYILRDLIVYIRFRVCVCVRACVCVCSEGQVGPGSDVW
jgi:hypothetical protein